MGIVIRTYLLALIAAIAIWLWAPISDGIIRALVADVVATLVVFGASVRHRNASLYDPYWSVAPLALAVAFFPFHAPTLTALLISVCIAWWGIRLTLNWIYRWRGLSDQDWRYTELRDHSGVWYGCVNLFGIHLMPTLLVFAGMVPVLIALDNTAPLSIWEWVATAICLLAIVIEGLSDRQLRRFLAQRTDRSEQLDQGLWAWSRHPNYFGEVLFWWGLFLFGWSASGNLWLLVGPIAMSLLFLLYSVPAMDRRMLASNPEYARRLESVSGLIPWPPRRS